MHLLPEERLGAALRWAKTRQRPVNPQIPPGKFSTYRLTKLGIPLTSETADATQYGYWLRAHPLFECSYCRKRIPDEFRRRSVDHFIPLTKGGTHCVGNLVPSCRSCNSSKGVKLRAERPVVPEALSVETWLAEGGGVRQNDLPYGPVQMKPTEFRYDKTKRVVQAEPKKRHVRINGRNVSLLWLKRQGALDPARWAG